MSRYIAFFLAILTSASATGQDSAGPYIGIGLNSFDSKLAPWNSSDSSTFYRAYAGYRIGKGWSVEGSYGRALNLDWEQEFTNPPTHYRQEWEYTLSQVRGLRYFGEFFLGLGLWDANIDYATTATSLPLIPQPNFSSWSSSRSDSGWFTHKIHRSDKTSQLIRGSVALRISELLY